MALSLYSFLKYPAQFHELDQLTPLDKNTAEREGEWESILEKISQFHETFVTQPHCKGPHNWNWKGFARELKIKKESYKEREERGG